jgi:hypothetical protein
VLKKVTKKSFFPLVCLSISKNASISLMGNPSGREFGLQWDGWFSSSYGKALCESGAGFACVPLSCRAVPSCGGNFRDFGSLRRLGISFAGRHSLPLKTPHGQSFHRHPRQHQSFLCNALLSSVVSPPNLPHEWRMPRSWGEIRRKRALFGYFLPLLAKSYSPSGET